MKAEGRSVEVLMGQWAQRVVGLCGAKDLLNGFKNSLIFPIYSSIHSFMHSPHLYWVPTRCQAHCWGLNSE